VLKKILNYSKKNFLIRNLVNIIFPPHCLICGKQTDHGNICKECLSKVNFLEFPLIEHRGKTYFYAITKYEGVSASIVKILKFGKKKSIAQDISYIISQFILNNSINVDYVGFLPMSRQEKRMRGFNQSFLIAKGVADILGIDIYKGAKKVVNTKKQVGLNRKERMRNIRDAFKAGDPVNGTIVLIDDVYTTGSTANEFVKEIRKVVSGKIIFIAFSRKLN